MKIMLVLDHQTFGDDCVDIAKKCAPYSDIIWFRIKDINIIDAEAQKLRKALPDTFLSLSLDAAAADRYGYDAVQLGANSDVESVRDRYPHLKIGYSAHSVDEVESVDADYFTLSPIFFTKKDYEVHPLGAVDVSELSKEIYALGGIGADNAAELRSKGYSGVAGISFAENIEEIRKLVG